MEGATVHSLQVAWLTAVSFGARDVTLPLSAPNRLAADEPQAGGERPKDDTFRLASY